MAVLKDLIVHGSSRFINAAYFNSLGADKISANEGVFNKLIATNLTAEEASITDLTATNAKVMGLLDVKGELHTNKWTNSNISNVGGSFYISPTVNTTIASGNTPMSITITGTANNRSFQVSGGNFTTDAVKIYENDTTHSVYATGTTAGWPVGSHVMVTGNIRLTSTGVDYPLGTLTGYLTAYLSQGGFTVGGVDSPALETIITELGTSNLKSYDISISMFEIGPRGANSLKPVGIMMTSYGVDKSTYIDIYGGVNTKTTDSATGLTDPNVRIGYLGGIPAYQDSNGNSHKPVGWGIYTDNGYFKGVVVADSGLVGNFTISTDLHSGTTGIGLDNNVYVSPGTLSEGISIANSPEDLVWAFTAGPKFGVTTSGDLYANGATLTNLYIGNSDTALDSFVRIEDSGIMLGNIDGFHIFIDGKTVQDPNNNSQTIPADENTYGLGFYQTDHRAYKLTNDAQIIYLVTDVQSNDNPFELGLYELVDTEYVLTSDTSPVSEKIYYRRKKYYTKGDNIRTYNLIENPASQIGQGETPKSLGWYEEDTSNRDRRIAYINNNELSIPYTVVLSGMKLGHEWIWELNQTTHNLTLKWMG